MLTHDSVTQFLARRDDGSIVGVSTLVTFPIPTAIRAWVEDVIVDEASNNQGIGRQLLDAMVERARQLGAKTVDLTSRPSREAANHLYRKAGFERPRHQRLQESAGNSTRLPRQEGGAVPPRRRGQGADGCITPRG